MACGGSATGACGGPNWLLVYTSTANVTTLPTPTIQNTSLPGSWQYQGCLLEPGNRLRMFSYELDWMTNNTVDTCLNQHATYEYSAARLEYGKQCFCGDISDVTANNRIATWLSLGLESVNQHSNLESPVTGWNAHIPALLSGFTF
ncbi:hypothetical protein OG21DRAFT_1524790 [Imleria badia]|nr:hypothetical protein OG21DRAFT_1524790 [Imleria badia]